MLPLSGPIAMCCFRHCEFFIRINIC